MLPNDNSIPSKLLDLERRLAALEQHSVDVVALDELSDDLGLQMAGEFRAGNGEDPDAGAFSGVRIVYPPLVIGGKSYSICGFKNGVLQFGLSSEDGTAVFAGGQGVIDAEALKLSGIFYGLLHTVGDGAARKTGKLGMTRFNGELGWGLRYHIPGFGYNIMPNSDFSDGSGWQQYTTTALNGTYYCVPTSGFLEYYHTVVIGDNSSISTGTLGSKSEFIPVDPDTMYEMYPSWQYQTSGAKDDFRECSLFVEMYDKDCKLILNAFIASIGLGTSNSVEGTIFTQPYYFLTRVGDQEIYYVKVHFTARYGFVLNAPNPFVRFKCDYITLKTSEKISGFFFTTETQYSGSSIRHIDAAGARRVMVSAESRLPKPPAPGVVDAGSDSTNNVPAGMYSYAVTFIDESGESQLGNPSSITLSSPSQVSIKVPVGPPGTRERRVYRTYRNSNTGIFYLLRSVFHNGGWGFLDYNADSDLGTTEAPRLDKSGCRPVFPITASMFFEDAETLDGYLTTTLNASQRFGVLTESFSNDGLGFTFPVWISSGSYTLSLLGCSINRAGKSELYIDGVLIENSLMDWYSSSQVFNVSQMVRVTIDVPGLHFVKIKINGKNAASLGYSLILTRVTMTRVVAETTYVLQPDGAAGCDSWIASDVPNNNNATAASIIVGEANDLASNAKALLKFDLSSVATYFKCQQAYLELTVSSDKATNLPTICAYELLRDWVENQVTWNVYSTGNAWQTAGAAGVNDRGELLGSVILSANEAVGAKVRIFLSPTVVSSWKISNCGLLLETSGVNDQYFFHSSDSTAPLSRPKLVLMGYVATTPDKA